jgi:hypothetical protein
MNKKLSGVHFDVIGLSYAGLSLTGKFDYHFPINGVAFGRWYGL